MPKHCEYWVKDCGFQFNERKHDKHHYKISQGSWKKYDYSQVDFISSKLKVKIDCKDHGIFEQRPDHHLEGKGCFKCGKGGKKFDLKYVIEQFHLVHPVGRYDYSQVEYINAQSDIKIICTKHKTHFFQTVADHKGLHYRLCFINIRI